MLRQSGDAPHAEHSQRKKAAGIIDVTAGHLL